VPDVLQGLLVGRKLLPLVSQEAQPGTVDAVDAKSLRVQQHLFGKQRVRVSVYMLEHVLKATCDLEKAAEACGVADGSNGLSRRNVFAKVFSQYHRHVNDERELFAEVVRLGQGEGAYAPDWKSAPDAFCLPWKPREDVGQAIDLEELLSPEELVLQRQTVEILSGHSEDKRVVIKRELQRDEKVACCLPREEPLAAAARSTGVVVDVPDYTRSYRRRTTADSAPPPQAKRRRREDRSKSLSRRRPAAAARRQQPRQQPRQSRQPVWRQPSPPRAVVCEPLGLLSEEARRVPAALRDLRRCLTEQAAKTGCWSTQAVMEVVRSIPQRGLAAAVATLTAAGYDVADLAAFDEGRSISAEHVETAFHGFEVHFYWDSAQAAPAFVRPPAAGESLTFVRFACCIVAWLSYLEHPWVELLLVALHPYRTGSYASCCAVDACLNPHVHGFDLEFLRSVTRRGGADRDVRHDVVAYNYFRTVLDDLVRRHWSVGHSKAAVGLNPYSIMVGARWAVQTANRRGGRVDELRLFADLRRLARASATLKAEVTELCGEYELKRQEGCYRELPAELIEELRVPGCFPDGEQYAASTEVAMAPVCVAAAPWPW
jgi:hypothetical protein